VEPAEEGLTELSQRWPMGTQVRCTLDDFTGTVQGYYTTRGGKPGLVIQYHDRRFCHLYGESWIVKEEPA
jgi:hypothetical protein